MSSLHKRLLYLLFALSGFCALIYEILWTKYLSLTFGTTMIAVSIVAATFMGGLALGSFLLGRYADQETDLLGLYALLELGIAVFALLLPPTLKIVLAFHTWLEQVTPDNPAWTHGIHFLFSAILLVPPTACMGGTFPLMCRLFARKKSGGHIGRLYALNTVGATVGAFSAGYFLLPAIGLSATGFLASGLNLAIAAIAWRLSARIRPSFAVDVSQATRPKQSLLAKEHRRWLIAIGLIGFFSLAYEILWTRVFLLFLGNTTYAFSLILSTFLISLALGGALYARLARPELDEKKTFILLSSLMGFALLATLPFYDQLAHISQFAHEVSGERWWHLSLLSFGIVFAVVCLPTILSGALLPAAVAILDPGEKRTGEGVGLVVLYNTVGAVLGSLVAGFFMVPAFGIQNSLILMAVGNILLACLLLVFHQSGRWRLPAAGAMGAAALVLALVPAGWDAHLMNSGVYIYAPKYALEGGIDSVLEKEKVIEVIEGIDTTVAIHESLDGDVRFFTVNGKTDGGTGRDMATQILVSHLPMLMHRSPEDVLMIGLGTGISLRGLSSYPARRIDCVEISPEVVRASHYFTEANHSALDDPKVNLVVEDGRNLLLSSRTRYDVIISEPSNPWQTGNANLFTHEFYDLSAERLKEGGIFCQWIGIYDITPENLRMAVNTFLQSFPRSLAFKAGSDLVLLGSRNELAFNYRQMQDRFKSDEVKNTLRDIGINSPGELVGRHYLCSEKSLANFCKGAGLNTDDHPVLEYSARHLLGERLRGGLQMKNMDSLLSALDRVVFPITNLGDTPSEIARALRDFGRGLYEDGKKSQARQFMLKAAEIEGAPAIDPGTKG